MSGLFLPSAIVSAEVAFVVKRSNVWAVIGQFGIRMLPSRYVRRRWICSATPTSHRLWWDGISDISVSVVEVNGYLL